MSINKAILIHDGIVFDTVDISESGLTPELVSQGYKLYDFDSMYLQNANDYAITKEDRENYLDVFEVFDYNEETQTYTHHFEKQIHAGAVVEAIQTLKTKLVDLDYMNSKNQEYEALGLELPYTWEEIHAAKQPIRDEINRLQELITPTLL